MNCLSWIRIEAASEVRAFVKQGVFVKQGSVGVERLHGCEESGELWNNKDAMQLLAAIVWKIAGGALESLISSEKFKFSMMQQCVQKQIHSGHPAPLWMAVV